MIAKTSEPPYYAVIFTSLMTADAEGYSITAERMDELSRNASGYLGVESVRNGLGITVSYWKSLEDIKKWKANMEHLKAQETGKSKWYAAYKTRIALVEDDYEFVNKADAI